MLTLALGIGATTAIFSAVNPILFEPLPYPRAERIAMISDVGDRRRAARHDVRHVSRDRRAQPIVRARLAVMRAWQPTLTGASEPERLDGQRVSAGYFRALGVTPALGRDFRRPKIARTAAAW